jgi:hypothetical protein
MVNKVLFDAPFSPCQQEIALVLIAQTTNRFIESWLFLSLPTFVFFTSAARFLCLPLLCHSFFSLEIVELGSGDVKLVLASVGCNMLVVSFCWGFLWSLQKSHLSCFADHYFSPRRGRRTSGPALGSFRALRCSLLCGVKIGNLSPPVVSSLEWKHPRKKPVGILL